MKKVMFGIAGVMAVLASANAVDTAEIKTACQRSDKTYWVESTNACIPKNPCKADQVKYGSYCINAFKNVETPNVGIARKLSEGYLTLAGRDVSYCEGEHSLVGQNYIYCYTRGGGYAVFEFDDTTNNELLGEESVERLQAFTVLCEVAGGKISPEDNSCTGISKTKCDDLWEKFYLAYNGEFDSYFSIKSSYYESTKSCKVTTRNN